MENLDDLDHEKKLKISIYKDVKTVCNSNADLLGLSIDKSAKNLIAELVWKKVKIISEDLEFFAKHAKRASPTAEDVKLVVRHNELLKEEVTKLAEELKKGKNKNKKGELASESDIADEEVL